MDLHLDEGQALLRESARDVLARECPMSLVRATMERGDGFDPGLWERLAELGWTGLVVPERYGGAGLGWLELALVLEQLGAVLAPGPFLTTAAVAVHALECAGSDGQRERWLPAIASGELRVGLAALEESGREGPEGIGMVAEPSAGGFVLSGQKVYVPDAPACHVLLVPARLDGGIALFWVGTEAVRTTPIAWLDPTRPVHEVTLSDVGVDADALLGPSEPHGGLLRSLLDVGRLAVAAELCGAAQRVLDLSVRYAGQREQFGRPIGAFQAIQHKCADMMVRVEAARSAVYYAAWALGEAAAPAHLAACMAKSYASDAGTEVAGQGIQIHGGLGFTWEQDLHLYYKRAKASALRFGSPAWNDEQIATQLIDEAHPLP